jgi:hypothetical protein
MPIPSAPQVIETDAHGLIGAGLSVNGGTLFFGAGAPPASLGSGGDFYFRMDGIANTRIYHREAGAWVATAA